MIETVGQLIKQLHSYGSACPVLFMHHGETIQILTVSGASDGSVILMSDEAAPIDVKPKRRSVSSNDADEVLDQCDRILEMCDEVPTKGEDFAESVREKVESIAEWIRENEHVTDAQKDSLNNMERGVGRWIR